MRCLAPTCLPVLCAVIFGHAATGQQQTVSPAIGLAFPDGRQEIVIEVRCIDADADGMRPYETGLRPMCPTADDLSFSTSEVDAAEPSGIRLVSAKRIERTDYPVFTKVFENRMLREVIQTVQSSERSNVSFAPRVKVRDGDTAEIFSGRSSWSSTESSDKGGGDSPQLRPLEDGTRLRLRASVLESGTIRLDFRMKDTHLKPVAAESEQQPTTATTFDTEFSIDLRPETTAAVWGLSVPRDPNMQRTKSVPGLGRKVVPHRPEMRLILLTPRVEEAPPAVQQVSGSSAIEPERLTR